MQPAQYQLDASGHVYERDSSMVFARMGTGKTLVNLMTMRDWIQAKDAKRIMVVAPLRVINNVWRQEAKKWQIPLSFSLVSGELNKKQRDAAVAAKTDVLLVNYEMFPKLLEADHGCDAVVFDELSKLRNPTGKRQKAARRGPFNIRTGCTGTPAPNGLGSIYGMAQAVGLGHLVGRNHDRWLRQYFYPTDYEQRTWAPLPGAPQALAELIRPYTYVLEDNAVELPPIVRQDVTFDLPDDLRELYDRFRSESVLSDYDIVAGSAGVLRNKLRQVSSGFVYDNAGSPVSLDPCRLEVLEDIVAEQNGQPLLVAYEYREQLAMLRERWPGTPYLGGGSSGDDQTLEDWNAGRLPLLFLHPASAGHGLNMQGGGSAIAWLQLPDDLELYDQTVARLVRRGQAASSVYSYEICALNTIDETVADMAASKTRTQDRLWEELRR